jgi:hypothetical protein
MAKKIKKVLQKSTLGGALGFFGADEDKAKKEAERTRQAQMQQEQTMRTLQQNMATDLRGENVTDVVAGGSADASLADSPTKKRRAGGLTAALGGF